MHLEQAVEGEEYPGWKVVEGRSNRKWTDEAKIAEILLENEYTKDVIYKPGELQGLTNMEKVVGKKEVAKLIGDYIEKPVGKPVLVAETDKRPVFNSAKTDFGDQPNE